VTTPAAPQPPAHLFSYFDGEKIVYCDPLEVYIAFARACDGDPDGVLRDAAAPEEGAEESSGELLKRLAATETLVKASRIAFGLAPIDQATAKGIDGDRCLTCLYSWLEWMEKKSAPSGTTATSPPATGQGRSPSNPKPSSASGSASTGNGGAAPRKSPTGSGSS
jgi:hypothetical protein